MHEDDYDEQWVLGVLPQDQGHVTYVGWPKDTRRHAFWLAYLTAGAVAVLYALPAMWVLGAGTAVFLTAAVSAMYDPEDPARIRWLARASSGPFFAVVGAGAAWLITGIFSG